jgi:hypothetical protein
LLHAKLDQLEEFSGKLEASGEKEPGAPDDALDWLGRLARRPLRDSTMRRLRATVGNDDFATFLVVASEIASGKFNGWGDPGDRKLLGGAFGFILSPENKDHLIAVSRVLELTYLRRVLKETSSEELEKARDELNEILELLHKLINLAANFIGKQVADSLGPMLSHLDFRRFLLVAWLAARKVPTIEALRDTVLGMQTLQSPQAEP